MVSIEIDSIDASYYGEEQALDQCKSGWCRGGKEPIPIDESPAIFIRSPLEEEGESNLSVEETILAKVNSIPVETIQKSALLDGLQEAVNITVRSQTPEVKVPHRVRRFHSWLSYLYPSGSGKNSPISRTKVIELDLGDDDEDGLDGNVHISRLPIKGILKSPKRAPSPSMAFPPPIQKSIFLKQEQITRMSRFTKSLQNCQPGQSIKEAFLEYEDLPPIDKNNKLKFDLSKNLVHSTYGRSEYERGGVEYIAKCLTPEVATMIKRELNEVKCEMEVHEESRKYTQFYLVK